MTSQKPPKHLYFIGSRKEYIERLKAIKDDIGATEFKRLASKKVFPWEPQHPIIAELLKDYDPYHLTVEYGGVYLGLNGNGLASCTTSLREALALLQVALETTPPTDPSGKPKPTRQQLQAQIRKLKAEGLVSKKFDARQKNSVLATEIGRATGKVVHIGQAPSKRDNIVTFSEASALATLKGYQLKVSSKDYSLYLTNKTIYSRFLLPRDVVQFLTAA